jgi:NAD-dependent SIR2 family protein deacetylase
VSTASGIPDFRTPGTGLYSQLEAYDLPTPEAIFELSYFRRNPKPFHLLARELFPGGYPPTRAHSFMKLLHDKGLLLRVCEFLGGGWDRAFHGMCFGWMDGVRGRRA